MKNLEIALEKCNSLLKYLRLNTLNIKSMSENIKVENIVLQMQNLEKDIKGIYQLLHAHHQQINKIMQEIQMRDIKRKKEEPSQNINFLKREFEGIIDRKLVTTFNIISNKLDMILKKER